MARAAGSRQAIFEWIKVFYNRQRMHAALGYLAPTVVEERMLAMLTVA